MPEQRTLNDYLQYQEGHQGFFESIASNSESPLCVSPDVLIALAHDEQDVTFDLTADPCWFSRKRNNEGKNISFHDTAIWIPKDELHSGVAAPVGIQASSQEPLWDKTTMVGFTKYDYFYTHSSMETSHSQHVSIVNLEASFSEKLLHASIGMYALPQKTDHVFGSLFLQQNSLLDTFDVPSGDGAPFLVCTPERALVKHVACDAILAEVSYQEVREATGIKASFTNTSDHAILSVASGTNSFKLTLGKTPIEKYATSMLDGSEQWITNSNIQVASIPAHALN